VNNYLSDINNRKTDTISNTHVEKQLKDDVIDLSQSLFNDNLEQGISSEETVPKCIEENKDAEVHDKVYKDVEVHNTLHVHKDATVHDKLHKDAKVHDKSHNIEHSDKGTNMNNDPMREEINFEQKIESRLKPFVRQMEIMENSIVKITEKLSDHIIAQNDNKIESV